MQDFKPDEKQKFIWRKVADQIISEHFDSESKCRKRGIRNLITRILYAKAKNDWLYNDPDRQSGYGCCHRWWVENVARGYYPLPSKYLRKANARYHEPFKVLKEEGYLRREVNYSDRGKANHYSYHFPLLDYYLERFREKENSKAQISIQAEILDGDDIHIPLDDLDAIPF